jgi:hypothetical protein
MRGTSRRFWRQRPDSGSSDGALSVLHAIYRHCMPERAPKPQVCPVCKSKDIERDDRAPAPDSYTCGRCGSAWSMGPISPRHPDQPR